MRSCWNHDFTRKLRSSPDGLLTFGIFSTMSSNAFHLAPCDGLEGLCRHEDRKAPTHNQRRSYSNERWQCHALKGHLWLFIVIIHLNDVADIEEKV